MHFLRHSRQQLATVEPGEIPSVDVRPGISAATVLDIGCGNGQLIESLAAPGSRCFGIDINAKAVVANTARSGNVRYSQQDISRDTTFLSGLFELQLLRHTLSSIHHSELAETGREIGRLAADGGLVWLAEPLVSEAYADRYALAENLTGEPTSYFVFNDPALAAAVRTPDQLRAAADADKLAGVRRHYTTAELAGFLPDFDMVGDVQIEDTVSPSGYQYATGVVLVQKRPADLPEQG